MINIMITGASSGLGKACCQLLTQQGFQVIGIARREDKLNALKNELGDLFYPLPLDICDKHSIDIALSALPDAFKEIDILINNAGLALGLDKAHQTDFNDWDKMIQTNITALTYMTRKLLPQMVERNQGLIINIGSIAGNYAYPGANVYGATKAFVKQFSLNLRADLLGTKIKVTNIEPGLCGETEFSNVRLKGDDLKAQKLYENVDYIKPIDIANTILWIIQQPAYINFNRIEIMPVAQSFAALPVIKKNDESI